MKVLSPNSNELSDRSFDGVERPAAPSDHFASMGSALMGISAVPSATVQISSNSASLASGMYRGHELCWCPR